MGRGAASGGRDGGGGGWKTNHTTESDYVAKRWEKGDVRVNVLFDMDRGLAIRTAGTSPVNYDVYKKLQNAGLIVDDTRRISGFTQKDVREAVEWANRMMGRINNTMGEKW